MHSSIDRRAYRRFRFSAPVLFRWAERKEHYEAGKSGNVGLGGMFIFASECPPLGAQVEIEFAIPTPNIPRQLRFCCKGQVIRVETCYEIAGFAVAGRIEGELPVDGEQLGANIAGAPSLLTLQ